MGSTNKNNKKLKEEDLELDSNEEESKEDSEGSAYQNIRDLEEEEEQEEQEEEEEHPENIEELEELEELEEEIESTSSILGTGIISNLLTDTKENKISTTLQDLEYGKYAAEKFIEDLILENTYENNLCSDISKIDLIKDFTQEKQKLEKITDIFIDNIMLCKLFSKKEGTGRYLHKDIIGFWNTRIRKICLDLNIKVVPHSVKCKNPILYGGKETIHARKAFKELTDERPEIISNFLKQTGLEKEDLKDCYIGIFKLELADENFNTIHTKLKKLETELSKYENQIYIKDIDSTIDYAGTFSKEKIIGHLLEIDNFYMEGCGDIPTDTEEEIYIIMDNNKAVSKGTLTFLEFKNNKLLNRYKIYNKAFAQFSSPGVANTCGTHLMDFLHCPDARLNETFKNPKAKEQGITRLEITHYRNTILEKEEMEEHLNFLYSIINKEIFYHVPIANLWKNLAELIINNLIVVNRKARLLYIVYYVNLETKKIIGIKYKIPLAWEEEHINKCLLYVISNFSYEVLPCYLLEIHNTYKEDYNEHFKKFMRNKKEKINQTFRNLEMGLTITNIELTLKKYQKPQGETQLARNNYIYGCVEEVKNLDIEEAGLKGTDFIKWYVLKCKGNIGHKPKYNINKIDSTKKVISTLSRYKREKKLLEKQKILLQEEYINNNKTDIENAREEYKRLKEQYKKIEQEKEAINQNIKDVKNVLKGNALSLKDLDGNKITVKAFLKRYRRDETEILIILREEDNKAYYAPNYLITIINNSIKNTPFIDYGDNIYGNDKFKSIITVIKDGFLSNGVTKWKARTYINENLKKDITIPTLETKKRKLKEKISNISIQKLHLNKDFKLKESEKFDSLELNKEYKITHLGTHTTRKADKERFYFKVEGSDKIYRTNIFMDEYLQNKENSILLKFKTLDLSYNYQTRTKELKILPTKTDKKNKINDIIFNQ
jgi:hypothetical protein